MLFAGKAHATDAWQIWEIALAGGAARRITAGQEDCIRPFYLPDDRIVYSRRIEGRFVMEVKYTEGKPLPVTYVPGSALPTGILHDGRILFAAAYPLGTGVLPEIYTVYSDGSGVRSYRCDHGHARYSATQASSGELLFASETTLARFTSARASELRFSVPTWGIWRGFRRDWRQRMVGLVASTGQCDIPVDAMEAGQRRIATGSDPAGSQCHSTGSSYPPTHAEPASVGDCTIGLMPTCCA